MRRMSVELSESTVEFDGEEWNVQVVLTVNGCLVISSGGSWSNC